MRNIFNRFGSISGALLNLNKTTSIDVGFVNGNPIQVDWLRTDDTIKILGVVFTNYIRRMISLNWDALVGKVGVSSLPAFTHYTSESNSAKHLHHGKGLVFVLNSPFECRPRSKTYCNYGNVFMERTSSTNSDATACTTTRSRGVKTPASSFKIRSTTAQQAHSGDRFDAILQLLPHSSSSPPTSNKYSMSKNNSASISSIAASYSAKSIFRPNSSIVHQPNRATTSGNTLPSSELEACME